MGENKNKNKINKNIYLQLVDLYEEFNILSFKKIVIFITIMKKYQNNFILDNHNVKEMN